MKYFYSYLEVFLRKLKKAVGKKETSTAESLKETKPIIKLDHIVKERFLYQQCITITA